MMTIGRRDAIARVKEVCEAVAAGDFEARILNITEKGDMGELMHIINLMIDRMDAYVRESQACLEHVSRNEHFRLIVETGMTGAFLAAAKTINDATIYTEQRQQEFTQIANRFEDKMGTVVDTVSHAVSDLHQICKDVDQSSGSAKEQSTAVAAGAEQASANMQSVAAATEELTSAIGEIAHQISSSTDTTSKAVQLSDQMNRHMDELADASKKVVEVIKLISDIAAQTNLLALNATIEASRAGEAGKGFAVVAQEVKNLAGQTAKATDATGKQIAGIRQAIDRSVSANSEINESIARVDEVSATIASAVEEQNSATREISRNVTQAAKGTTEVSSNILLVDSAIDKTQSAVSKVIDASANLSNQEAVLRDLRTQMQLFLDEVRKVG